MKTAIKRFLQTLSKPKTNTEANIANNIKLNENSDIDWEAIPSH